VRLAAHADHEAALVDAPIDEVRRPACGIRFEAQLERQNPGYDCSSASTLDRRPIQ
jgi:hypothetical protein